MKIASKRMYPQTRLRRLREQGWLRDLVQETHIHVTDLIWPLFIRDPQFSSNIPHLPGVQRYSIDELPKVLEHVLSLGIRAVAYFPVVAESHKTGNAAHALDETNILCQALQCSRKYSSDLGIIADVALDPFTSHGHDGLYDGRVVVNDTSIEMMAKMAVLLAECGANCLAPSDMMDGRIGHIRQTLDAAHYDSVPLISYAAKYASSLYGPFREAVGSKNCLQKSTKVSYQMNPANRAEALQEVELDLSEGADAVLIKPGMYYLDIIREVKTAFGVPTFAYQVSGEYSMLRHAIDAGYIEEKTGFLESILCLKRAGADAILTYAAPTLAQWIKEEHGTY